MPKLQTWDHLPAAVRAHLVAPGKQLLESRSSRD
jgi:hypothetical protein